MTRLGKLSLVALLVTLSACATSVPTQTYPDLTFQHHQPINLNVGKIEIIEDYRMPFKAPNIEHEAPLAPSAATRKWVTDVLRATGSSGRAVVIISDGSMIKEGLKTTGGIKGVFTVDQSQRYTTRIEARIEVRDDKNRRLGEAQAFASRNQTVPEDITANDRGLTLYRLVEDTTNDFAESMSSEIKTHLRPYLQ